ncbi:hypothetical protein ACXIHB_10300 [Tenacibaculum sp. IMCC1]
MKQVGLPIPIRQGVLKYIENKFNNGKVLPYEYRAKGKEEKIKSNLQKDLVIYLIFYLIKYTEEEGHGIYLNSKNLKKNFLYDYKPYLSFLEDLDFIILGKKYIVGNRSNFYGLTNTFYDLDSKYITYQITNVNLLKKLNGIGLTEEQILNNEFCKRERNHLVKSFDENLKIDLAKALEEIKNLNKQLVDFNSITIYQYQSQVWSYNIKKNTDNRLHTIITRTNKKLLKHITYRGKRLGEIDFKTSQPLFLFLMLKSVFEKPYNNVINTFISKKLGAELIKKLKDNGINLDELNEFGNIIINKDIYLHVAENIKINPKTDLGFYYIDKSSKEFSEKYFDTKRDLIKNVVMRSLYNGKGDEVYEFRKLFPSIFDSVNIINKYKKVSQSKNNLSHFLQSFEAHVILDLIAKEVDCRFKKIPLFSKHDSLITYNSIIDEVQNFVISRFKYYFNIENDRLITKKSW